MLMPIDAALDNIDKAISALAQGALSGTTGLDEGAFDQVRQMLVGAEDVIGKVELQHVKMAQTTFGRSPSGLNLADQHAQAQDVTVATLKGVVQDLQDFAQRLTAFKDNLQHSDTTSAADLAKIQAAVNPDFHSDEARREAIQKYVHSTYQAPQDEGGANA